MRTLPLVVSVLASAVPLSVRADDAVHDRHPTPTPLWLAFQAIPTVDFAFGEADGAVGLRWQITALSYSWGINRRLSPVRVLVVEPLVRHGGSVEAWVSGGVWFGQETEGVLRAGVRTYVPLVEHGEQLSASFAIAYQRAGDRDAAAIELGMYTLFGILGLQISAAVPDARFPVVVSLSLRYF